MEHSVSDRVASQGPLAEFKTAIEQEIDAAKKNSAASAVTLTDGKLVAPVGGAFHYTFDTSARVGVPPDTDGELILPNRPQAPLAVTLVEIADLTVTLAVPEHIGRVVPAAKLQTDLTMLLTRLINRIDEKAQEGHSAADRVLDMRVPSGALVAFSPINRKLSDEQRKAVASALGQDTTFVWGPPGTGKTYSIGEIGAQLFGVGKTLLIASHTNTAVDGAVLKIAEALEQRVAHTAARQREATLSLVEKLRSLVEALAHWGLAEPAARTIPGLLARLRTAKARGRAMTAHTSLEQIRIVINRFAADIQRLQNEIDEIDQQLKQIDADLIANARILATTLTRTYLRNDIQSRTFDTVLVDEVSMAPIPAVWVAATLAQRAVVLIGDFLQLPPIVLSAEPPAKKWLGRDLFEVSGLSGAWYRREKMPSYFVGLKEQHRMHPEICAIVNALVYHNALEDGTTVTAAKADRELSTWLSPGPTWTPPVLLLDTSKYGGWNIARDNSRCNPLSAFLVAHAVRQMLAERRPKVSEGRPRILAISPYRPHAKLLQLLLREYELEKEAV